MKLNLTAMASLVAVTGIAVPRVCFSQADTARVVAADSFAPLNTWKNAVLAGDSAALKAVYSANPASKISVGSRELTPDADVEFWIGLKARSLKLDILQDKSPKPDSRVIVFQAEIRSETASQPKILYVSEAQAWQQVADHWILLAVQRTDAAHLQQPTNKDKRIYSTDANAHLELKEAEEQAALNHRRVLVVFGANWCYDCHVLDLAFQRPDFANALAGYEVVHIDIGDDGKKNLDVAKECEVPLGKGIPALAVLDSDGKLVVSQKNGEFENARALTPEALLEFLNKWKPETR